MKSSKSTTTRSRMFAIGTPLAGALILAGCGGKSSEPEVVVTPPPAVSKLAAEIRTTSHGIAHVKADDFKGAGYGYGYVFARDNICEYAKELLTIRGELSKNFGNPAGSGHLESDTYSKLHWTPSLAQKMKAAATLDVQDLTAGFVAGYNRYLKDKGVANLPSECKGAAWVLPMTEQDAYLRYSRVGMQSSLNPMVQYIGSAPQPPSGSAGREALGTPEDSPMFKSYVAAREHGLGSNGVGLGKEATQSGTGILFGNPHFPWEGDLRLHQLHLTVAGKYNAYGATLWGVPVPLIGFNKDVAWTRTYASDARMTISELKLDPTDPTKYIVDGQSKAMVKNTVKVDVLLPDGSLNPVNRTLYSTEFGVVAQDSQFFKWTKANAYAVHDVNYDNHTLMDQVMLDGKSTDVDSLLKSMGTYGSLPWVHTMSADRNGKALYANISMTPNLTDAQLYVCINTQLAQGLFYLSGFAMVDGSKSLCNWNGPVPLTKRPYTFRNDYIINANDSHWMPNAQVRLSGYPAIIAPGPSLEGVEQSERTRSGIAQIQDRMKGTDGLPGKNFTVANLQQMFMKSRFFKAEQWLDEFLAATCVGATQSAKDSTGAVVDLTEACKILKAWDKTDTPNSVGSLLFRRFYRNLGDLRTDPTSAAPSYWRIKFDPSDPVYTPRGFNTANTAAATKLADAVQYYKANNIGLTEVLAQRQGVTRNGKFIPIPGGAHSFNIFSSGLKDGKFSATPFGSSYIQFVTFDSNGPVAEGITTYSQSVHSSSPHFSDMTQLYSDIFLKGSKWVKLQFKEEDIKADPAYATMSISE